MGIDSSSSTDTIAPSDAKRSQLDLQRIAVARTCDDAHAFNRISLESDPPRYTGGMHEASVVHTSVAPQQTSAVEPEVMGVRLYTTQSLPKPPSMAEEELSLFITPETLEVDLPRSARSLSPALSLDIIETTPRKFARKQENKSRELRNIRSTQSASQSSSPNNSRYRSIYPASHLPPRPSARSKQPLSCFFCRARKFACRRPPNADANHSCLFVSFI